MHRLPRRLRSPLSSAPHDPPFSDLQAPLEGADEGDVRLVSSTWQMVHLVDGRNGRKKTTPPQLTSECTYEALIYPKKNYHGAGFASSTYTASLSSSVADYPVKCSRPSHAYRPGSEFQSARSTSVFISRSNRLHSLQIPQWRSALPLSSDSEQGTC